MNQQEPSDLPRRTLVGMAADIQAALREIRKLESYGEAGKHAREELVEALKLAASQVE